MTAGVHLGAFMAFAGLTAGIFAVLDVTLPEALILSSIAWGIGAVPIVALASAYQPDRLPTLQDWDQGLAKTLRLLTRLLTPLALLVLAIYLFGYIPMHFGGAFEERELRMVYNATIVAMLLCGAASGRAERDNAMPRYAMLALTMLTLALNLYCPRRDRLPHARTGPDAQPARRARLERRHPAYAGRHLPRPVDRT